MILPVVLAGGVGSRLWPMSRSQFPKQCLDIEGNGFSLLQNTVNRLDAVNASEITIVCNEDHRFLVADQLEDKQDQIANIILEPVGRNTAAAIAIAAWSIYEAQSDGVLLVLASDHSISDTEVFKEKVMLAYERAREGALVTFGIEPGYPETGYGYIKSSGLEEVSKVLEFVEKPDLQTAKSYLEDGSYLWNSGMFMFRADTFLEELKVFEPEMYKLSKEAFDGSSRDLGFLRLQESSFASIKSISVDYAVMERTKKAEVVRFPSIWNDIGSWTAMWDIKQSDENNNILTGDVVSHNTKNTLVHSENRLVATLGVEDLIIVDTQDALLIANRNNAQDIKKIVDVLESQDRPEISIHSEVHRPWGVYQTIGLGGRYQVKRITVKPGARLSTQMHHHRAEHWVVVKGTAIVRNGDQTNFVTENESTYIPVGEIHSLENPGKIPLELIEVQTGGYLGEDDIVRFDDLYGRSEKK